MKNGTYIAEEDGIFYQWEPSLWIKIKWKAKRILKKEIHLEAKIHYFSIKGDRVQIKFCQEDGARAVRMITSTGKWQDETISIKIMNNKVLEIIFNTDNESTFYIDSIQTVEK